MNRKTVVLMCLLTLCFFLFCGLSSLQVEALGEKYIEVANTGLTFDTIQDAINNNESSLGNPILVTGDFHENVVVNKSVWIVGSHVIGQPYTPVVIRGDGESPVFKVEADNVHISMIDITDGMDGILIDGADNCELWSMYVYGNAANGVYIRNSSHCTIEHLRTTENLYNFGVEGTSPEHFVHAVEHSAIGKWTDGKPIYYLANKHNQNITTVEAGYIAAANCTNITISNQNLANNRQGILLAYSNNCTVRNTEITNNLDGVFILNSHNITIEDSTIMLSDRSGLELRTSDGNTLVNNIIVQNSLASTYYGGNIRLEFSNGNIIDGNVIGCNHVLGMSLDHSSNNLIVRNSIVKNDFGVILIFSDNNTLFHNDFVNNEVQMFYGGSYNNTWDNGTRGNYWDDYTGLDDGSGDRVAGDSIGDTDLPHQGVDYYPFIAPLKPIPVIWENTLHPVSLVSNSTVSTFRFEQEGKKITFNVNGPRGTYGYCNVTIPKTLLRDNPWTVLVSNADLTSVATITENEHETSIYFTYLNRDYNVQIEGTWVIHEFPSIVMLMLVLMSTMMVAIWRGRERLIN